MILCCRLEGSSRASQSNRPLTPSEQMGKVKENKGSPVKKKSHSSSSQPQQQTPVASALKKDRPSPPSMPLVDTVPEPTPEPGKFTLLFTLFRMFIRNQGSLLFC